MRILLISSAFSGLTQRFFTELEDAGYEVAVELHSGDDQQLIKHVRRFNPALILCPYLTKRVPKEIYNHFTCLIVHPGIPGDRGPSSLDWAIQEGVSEWGVTFLEAEEEMDAGDIWTSKTFPMRATSKSSLFNREVTRAAIDCLWTVLTCREALNFQPQPLDEYNPAIKGGMRPYMKQDRRAIDWKRQTSAEIVQRIRAADGSPGVLDAIHGRPVYLYNAHLAEGMTGEPGAIVATANHAICRATVDGALWIGHLKEKKENAIKLPATFVVGDLLPNSVKTLQIDYRKPGRQLPCQEVWYEQENDIAYLYSEFHNGGMSTEQCRLLLEVYRHVATLPVKAIVLLGGENAWSNGIHLNHIEHAEDPAGESWLNINAIDDLIRQIITTPDKLTVAAVRANAGAGGAMMCLAADRIFAREGVVFNPHYKNMGGLFGSEYWTYLLPKRVGDDQARTLTQQCLPISAHRAAKIGFIDQVLDQDPELFLAQVRNLVELIIHDSREFRQILLNKAEGRRQDESRAPLNSYRQRELARMHDNFYASDDYHQARRDFVHKVPPSQTPEYLASRGGGQSILSRLFG